METWRNEIWKFAEGPVQPDQYRREHGECPRGFQFDPKKNHCVKEMGPQGTHAVTPAERGTEVKSRIKSFFTSAPQEAKRFFSDASYRSELGKKAGAAVRAAPGALAKRAFHAAKEEIHEFKTAGLALKKIATRQPLEKEDKQALAKVAVHMAITMAAAALTSSGAGVAASFAKGVGRGLAAKAVSPFLSKLHLGEEVIHILHHFAAENSNEDQMLEAMSNEIAQNLAATFENIDEQDVKMILTKSVEEHSKTASQVIPCGDCFRYATKKARELGEDAEIVHAIVLNPSPEPGERSKYEHAWVEHSGKVYDWQTEHFKRSPMTVAAFYARHKPQQEKRYTAEEAMIKGLRSGHHGPWHNVKASRLDDIQAGLRVIAEDLGCSKSAFTLRNLAEKLAISSR